MEKGSARLFQQTTPVTREQGWNIVELDNRKQVRQMVNSLLRQASDMSLTTSEMRQRLLQSVATFGSEFATQLVRSLHRDDNEERQSIIWLLTVLNDRETIPPLQQMSSNKNLPRAIRLAAALTLAGMGVTAETIEQNRRIHLYALS
jgi:HEAT repeat protein